MLKHVFSVMRFSWRRCSSWTKPLIRLKSNQMNDVTRCPKTSIPKSLQWCFSSRTFSGTVCKRKSKTHNPGDDHEKEHSDEDEKDFIEDEEVEELFQQHRPVGIGEEDHRVFIVHPDVKWGQKKQYLTTDCPEVLKQNQQFRDEEKVTGVMKQCDRNVQKAENLLDTIYQADLQMAEAVGLVSTLQNWSVMDKIILSTKTPEKKTIFGKGNFQMLTERIRETPGVSAVFMNVERLSAVSEKELQDAWGLKVFDRYSLVLHIFRRNARTKEAKLQISLAEIPLLRSRLKNEVGNLDQQGGGSRYIMGSGETLYEVQQRLLKEQELKIRSALERLRKKRHMLRTQRKHKDFPIVSVMGYTNCGKTTLIKALTGDVALQPKDQLFATLDVTIHGGRLPSHMTVLYVDTIGFLSQLPHQLIDSFSATLEDVAHSDLIVHVRDISHPETVNQKVNVLNVLKNLQIPERLMNSIIEVHNKIDLVQGYESPDPEAVPISALNELGLDELKQRVEESVMKSTGKQTMILKVDLNSPQLGWLYKEATVQEVHDGYDDCSAEVKVVIGAAAYGRYRKLFQVT